MSVSKQVHWQGPGTGVQPLLMLWIEPVPFLLWKRHINWFQISESVLKNVVPNLYPCLAIVHQSQLSHCWQAWTALWLAWVCNDRIKASRKISLSGRLWDLPSILSCDSSLKSQLCICWINIGIYLIFLWKLEVVVGLQALQMICQVHNWDWRVASHACQSDRL